MNETFYVLLIRSQSDFQYADSLYFYKYIAYLLPDGDTFKSKDR